MASVKARVRIEATDDRLLIKCEKDERTSSVGELLVSLGASWARVRARRRVRKCKLMFRRMLLVCGLIVRVVTHQFFSGVAVDTFSNL